MVNSEFNFLFMASWQALVLATLSCDILELLMAHWLLWHFCQSSFAGAFVSSCSARQVCLGKTPFS